MPAPEIPDRDIPDRDIPDRETDDLARLSATDLVARYADGSLSPVEATRACLDRIAAVDGQLNAMTRVEAEAALAAARESEARWRAGEPRRGPFGCCVDGVPTAIKDIVLVRGWPTRRGSTTTDPDAPGPDNSPAVARLREAGAVLTGMTATPEFGWKGVTDSPLTGVTRNPWNPEATPGGSSGGAAAAAATGMAALALGTDGGGSIRIPAGFTGVFGFKPSYGRIPAWPMSPFGTVSHLGPLTRTVADGALMFQVMAQPDIRDWTAPPYGPEDYMGALDKGVADLSIAFAPTLEGHAVDPAIAALVEEAARAFEALGARVERADPPLQDTARLYDVLWSVGAATLVDNLDGAARDRLDPGLAAMAAHGATFSAVDLTRVEVERRKLGAAMTAFHERYDLLLTPTLPIAAFAAGHDVPPGGPYETWPDWTPFCYPFNLTQQPAASVPCGLTAEGLPAGLQIVATRGADVLVLRAAAAFEAARPWPLPPLAPLAGGEHAATA
ncbi:MAG: amidase [Azospirillaceae bacterium]